MATSEPNKGNLDRHAPFFPPWSSRMSLTRPRAYSYKVADLRQFLTARQLPTTGVKADLVARLRAALEEEVRVSSQLAPTRALTRSQDEAEVDVFGDGASAPTPAPAPAPAPAQPAHPAPAQPKAAASPSAPRVALKSPPKPADEAVPAPLPSAVALTDAERLKARAAK